MKYLKLIGCLITATIVGVFVLIGTVIASPFIAFIDYITDNLIPSYKEVWSNYKNDNV